jgi:hypothetical protein
MNVRISKNVAAFFACSPGIRENPAALDSSPVKAAVQQRTMAQLKLTDEPVKQLRGLQDAMRTVKCNKQSRQYYQMLDEHLSVLTPAMEKQISSMIDAASFGETLKQGQLKALQVSAAITAGPHKFCLNLRATKNWSVSSWAVVR